jgi:branched-chain amino acid transport system substrate-binding protein
MTAAAATTGAHQTVPSDKGRRVSNRRKKIMRARLITALGLAALLYGGGASAQEITIGVTMGTTGSGASMGINYKNAFQLMPNVIGGVPVKYIILEDSSDPTAAAKNARQLVTENHVDALMGAVSVPSTTQVALIANETKTPLIALAPVALPPQDLGWTFIVPQPVPLMMGAVVDDMKTKSIKTVGYIGFSDSWGDLVLKALKQNADAAGITIVDEERYARADTGVTGQIVKILVANPDAVVVGGSGTGGALPQIALRERGFKGPIYHNHGTVNREFIKVGGAAVEGAIAPTGPLIVAEELPDSHPVKTVAADFDRRYETMFGAGSRNAFAGYSYDGFLLLAAAIPSALAKAKLGTPEFRAALRDALESGRSVVGTHGVYTQTPADHLGLDGRAVVLAVVDHGNWRLLKK